MDRLRSSPVSIVASLVLGRLSAELVLQTGWIVIRCCRAGFQQWEETMQRRTFMNMAAGFTSVLALEPLVFGLEEDRKNPVSYPDAAVEVIDPRFLKYKVINAAVERLYTGTRWAEGPVWFGDGRYLVFSDIPNNRMLRWVEETGEVSVFRSPSNYSNGNFRDREGRLLTCEHGTRRVTRTEHDGTITVLMDSFQGKKLNAPNDIVVHSDGAIWFSDPGYG